MGYREEKAKLDGNKPFKTVIQWIAVVVVVSPIAIGFFSKPSKEQQEWNSTRIAYDNMLSQGIIDKSRHERIVQDLNNKYTK